MNLENKVVVITGASSGIGKAMAKLLETKGAKVVASSRADTDVRDEVEVIRLAEQTKAQFGHIDIWINNAGVLHVLSKTEKLIDMEKARETLDVNFFGTVFGCRTALKYMQEGIVVNIISTAALDATRTGYADIYTASKWAVRGYTQALIGENSNQNIKILSVYPGGTKTKLFGNYVPNEFEDFMDPNTVAEKIINNLEQANPETELVIRRPKK